MSCNRSKDITDLALQNGGIVHNIGSINNIDGKKLETVDFAFDGWLVKGGSTNIPTNPMSMNMSMASEYEDFPSLPEDYDPNKEGGIF